jgi:subtilisin family serine protease
MLVAQSTAAAVSRHAAPGTSVLVVRVDADARMAGVVRVAHERGLSVRHELRAVHAVSLGVPSADLETDAAVFGALPGVRTVSPVANRTLQSTPNDPYYATHQVGYYQAVDAPAAWDIQRGSPAVRVAVVDSGVDVTHADLAGKVDGTYDAVAGATDTTDVTDLVGHGTFIAGEIAAATNNGAGVAAAGFDTHLLAVKINPRYSPLDRPDISVDDEVNGITWATDHGAAVIVLCLGGYLPDPVEQAGVDYALSHGVVVIAAAGNSNTSQPFYPAAYPGVMAVGATDGSARASFSNYGPWVTLAAPGVGVYSTTPAAGTVYFPPYYGLANGTSVAAPIVAGAAALLKAELPSATAGQIRQALVASAKPLSGLQLGAGEVDFAAALRVLAPLTRPAAVTASGTSGSIGFSATSSAPAVQFSVDGGPWSSRVPVTSGTAATTWPSWGHANGAHTVAARDCTLHGGCSTSTTSAAFTVSNTAPVITNPAPGSTVTGGFALSGATPGGGLRFLVDGQRVGFAAAPYSITYAGSGLASGWHTAQVVECDAAESACAGPASSAIAFYADVLHPSVLAITPDPFSPNGDGRDDTTTATFALPDAETVTARVLNSSGAQLAAANLGTLGAGSYSWRWDGTSAGARVPDGTYTVEIDTSATRNGTLLRGAAAASVRVDTAAPTLSSLTGGGTTFYPYPDGYRDTFSPGVTRNEGGTLTLSVRTSTGALVRTITATRAAGSTSLTWDGRNGSGVIVSAGTYTWQYTAADTAGNSRTSTAQTVYVSAKKLVAKTQVFWQYGRVAYGWGGTASCARIASSAYGSQGLRLLNSCAAATYGTQYAWVKYQATLPTAVRYGSVSVQVYGYSHFHRAALSGAFYRTDGKGPDVPRQVSLTSGTAAWYGLGSVSAAGHYTTSRVLTVAVRVGNGLGVSADFDIRSAEIVVHYDVLA